MSELKEWTASEIEEYDDARLELAEDGKIDCTRVYIKADVDKVIADLEESHKMEVEQHIGDGEYYTRTDADAVIAELKADYKEACDRLQNTTLIKDEQKAKVDKLLSCLKYLVMRDLIKDCPQKETATKIVKEYDNGLG